MSLPDADRAPVPQRARLVLGSDGRFDSRATRIAATLAGRGHDVLLVARRAPGVPDEERAPGGYGIVRVTAAAIDGLPLPAAVRRGLERRRSARGPAIADAAPGTAAPARRLAAGVRRIAAVVLTIRSQQRSAGAAAGASDVVFGMGFMGLPVALSVARAGVPVVYDAGDIYLEAGNIAALPGPVRRAFGRLERRWARRTALVSTANDGYADVMVRRFGVARPLVLLNCPPRPIAPAARVRRISAALGLPDDRPIVLYHGGFSPGRGIEQLIDAIGQVPEATLVLMGYGSLQATIEARVAVAELRDRVRVLPAVPQKELIAWIAGADVAAMPIQPTTLNHQLTVPNKLFEAMAAGVPVVASDLPGMAPIVRETGCGLLVDPTDPVALAVAIRTVLDAPPDQRAAWRRGGLEAVATRYSWEHQVPLLLAALERLTGNPW